MVTAASPQRRYRLTVIHYASLFVLALAVTTLAVVLKERSPQAVVENSKPLEWTLSLDRTAYFPDEAGLFTLTLRNPAGRPVAVPDLFPAGGGCFDLEKLDGGDLLRMSARPICPSQVVETKSRPITLLGGGEQRQEVFSFATLSAALDAPARKALRSPGYYRVNYLYHSHPAVVFQVVTPHLDAAAAVKLPDVSYMDSSGRHARLPAYLHVLALRWNQQTFICVSQTQVSNDRPLRADARGDFAGADFPYVRVAVSQEPVASITASGASQSHLTIEWVDAAGRRKTKVAGDAPAGPAPGAVQVGLEPTLEKLTAAQSRQFTATIVGSGNTNLTWSVALGPGAPARARAGVVDSSGTYLAPATVTRPYRVVLRARSQADEMSSAIAVVSLLPAARKAQQ